ncbi:MAG: hypothetical protein ACNA7J_03510 [Wenzhouxiangella sp.]
MVADVARTILDEVGVSAGFPGESVLRMGTDRRFREFVYLGGGETRTINRLEINGSAYLPGSYSQGERGVLTLPSREYRFGELVNVGLMGNGGQYLGAGWSQQDDRHCWSNDSEAVISLEVESPGNDLLLALDLIPHIHPQALPEQRVGIFVNGHKAGEWIGTERRRERVEVEVPKSWVGDSDMSITLRLPDAASPADLGTGGDRRHLGIALINILVSELPDVQDL